MERNRPKWRRVQGGFPSLGPDCGPGRGERLHVRIRGRGPTGQAGEKSVLGPRPKKRTSQAGKNVESWSPLSWKVSGRSDAAATYRATVVD
uniref:Uncharacterized protein n=1 Tax=Oryza sativa subsp. japonica TaxID=39947 RepID=Q6ERQ5_ORYSJ|nr:hypothetical protein [Oryza sativa Japonica Group]BAD33491.1 hypothetical protein [Oryza sativa Japonica Group]